MRLRGMQGCVKIILMATMEVKSAALEGLFSCIVQIAGAMGGNAIRCTVPVSHMSMTVAEPSSEDVPALCVEMPNWFQVEFTPSGPLSTPYVLSVNVRRNLHGFSKNGSSTNFVNDAWKMGQTTLSDDQIRAWLTLDGPPPAY